MSRPTTFDLYDRIVDGNLRSLLAGWREEGLSFDDVAYKLRDHGISVSRSTVGRWLKSLEAEEPAA
jgi:transposase-like protein